MSKFLIQEGDELLDEFLFAEGLDVFNVVPLVFWYFVTVEQGFYHGVELLQCDEGSYFPFDVKPLYEFLSFL